MQFYFEIYDDFMFDQKKIRLVYHDNNDVQKVWQYNISNEAFAYGPPGFIDKVKKELLSSANAYFADEAIVLELPNTFTPPFAFTNIDELNSVGYHSPPNEFYNLFPALRELVSCPVDECSLFPSPNGEAPEVTNLHRMIIHLNDKHRWTRDRIADWLDSLDINLEAVNG